MTSKIREEIIKEAARLLRDYPEMKYYEAIKKAKEVIRDDMEGRNGNK